MSSFIRAPDRLRQDLALLSGAELVGHDGGARWAGVSDALDRAARVDDTLVAYMARYVVGDGVADDTAAATAVHVSANTMGIRVSYEGLKRIALQADAQIPLKTSTDFAGCELVILGGVEASPSFASFNELFTITDDDCPLNTTTGAVAVADLRVGSLFPTRGLFDGHGYALLACALQVPDRDATATINYTQAFKVNRVGRVSHPLSADITAHAATITVNHRKTSKKRLHIQNVALVEGAWNNQRVFHVQRCNVAIEGLSLLFETPGTFDNVCEIVSISDASDIVVNDFTTSGRPVSTTVGSYCLAINGGADIYVNRMNALTGWGATGTNNINGVHFNDCVLNRIDAHGSGHNIFAENCDLHERGIVYGWGGGVISAKDCRAYRTAVIKRRGDYGGQFFGDLVVADCEVSDKDSVSFIVVDLETNGGIGASTPVVAPNSITVTNVKRTGRANGGNAEFIPVRLKINNAASVVYAPALIAVRGLSCHPGWRFGLRLDTLNMEANLANPITQIIVDGVTPDSACSNVSGMLDYPAVRVPAAPVRPRFQVVNSEHIHLQCLTAANLEIIVDNCSVNAIKVDTASATQPKVSVKNCRLLTAASGYANAPIGGGVSGTSGHTMLENCEIAAVAFDLSLVACAIGNTIRNGGLSPILPGAATAATFFTGYRQAGAFL